MCWDDSMGANKRISYWSCHNGHGNQLYKYLPETKVLEAIKIDSGHFYSKFTTLRIDSAFKW